MDGNRTKITRTHLGDISRITYGDGEDIEYSNNALGQLKAIKDSLGLTKIDRDILGRERNITDHKGRSISYEYDDAGNRTGIRYANGKNVRYIYDDRGLLTDIEASAPKMKSSSAPSSASVKATPAVSLSYDSYGRIASKAVGPAETAYTYDKCGHLASLVNKKNGTVLDSYEHRYDQAGNLVASIQKREGMPDATGSYEYGYDEIGRLNRVTKDGSPLRSYTYDAFGNRTILDEAGAKTEYLYNKANQLMRADTPHGTTIFEYDKRGNAIHKSTEGVSNTVSVNYTYGANNRLKQAVKNADGKSLTARYEYNGLGMRVSRATDTGSIDYVLDQTKMYNNLLESIQVDGQDSMSNPIESEDYTWLGNELVMADETAILSGRLGTPERLLGNTESASIYDEFGMPEVVKTPETTKLPEIADELPLGFTGYMRDDISDTLFAQAREYMPEIGRFMGRDIIKGRVEQPRSLNEYAYCHNDPVGFVDLNGMDEEKVSTIDYTTAMVRGGAENIGTDIADNKISSFMNKWQVATINKVYKQYDHDIRVNLGRSLNNMRPGRAANALAKFESLETAKAAKVSNVGNAAKLGKFTAKRILPIGVTAAGIYADYRADYNAGLSDTKIKSNMKVNMAYAATGTGVAAGGVAATPVVAGLLGVSSPPGWIVAGVIGGIWGLFTVATSDTVKKMINSLD
ncbi:RHS repeat-associated core domain-containing protein [Mogibacterium sp.]